MGEDEMWWTMSREHTSAPALHRTICDSFFHRWALASFYKIIKRIISQLFIRFAGIANKKMLVPCHGGKLILTANHFICILKRFYVDMVWTASWKRYIASEQQQKQTRSTNTSRRARNGAHQAWEHSKLEFSENEMVYSGFSRLSHINSIIYRDRMKPKTHKINTKYVH